MFIAKCASLPQVHQKKCDETCSETWHTCTLYYVLFLPYVARRPGYAVVPASSTNVIFIFISIVQILQLLVQKSIVTANSDFTKPGDVFRRVMECVASGLFLPTGPGLSDPCEKGLMDAAAGLTAQDRANLTLSAQVSEIIADNASQHSRPKLMSCAAAVVTRSDFEQVFS